MKICQKCNLQYEDNTNFCVKCGEQLSLTIKKEQKPLTQQAIEDKKSNFTMIRNCILVIVICFLGYLALAGNGFFKDDLAEGKENLKQEKYKEAFVIYDKYLSENPKSLEATVGRAKACIELNRLEEAKRDINRALEYKKDSSEAVVALGMYYSKIASQIHDGEEYRTYLFKKFNNMKVDEATGNRLIDAFTDKQLDAYLIFSEAIKLNPKNLDAYVERAALFTKMSIPFYGKDIEKVKKVNSEVNRDVIMRDLRFVIDTDKNYYKAYFHKAKMLGEFYGSGKDGLKEALSCLNIYTEHCGNSTESNMLKESILKGLNL